MIRSSVKCTIAHSNEDTKTYEIAEDETEAILKGGTNNSSSESEESSTFCRHCLRPQAELQMHYLRPPRPRSKFRQHENLQQFAKIYQPQTNVLAGATVRRTDKPNGDSTDAVSMGKQQWHCKRALNVDGTKLVMCCDARNSAACDLNAANAEVIRFRCPQVGPLVGHNVASVPMHFHHPQHQQQHHYAYQQYQYYQQQLLLQQQQQQLYANTTISMESERKSTSAQQKVTKTIRPTSRKTRLASNKERKVNPKTTIELPLLENTTENFAIVENYASQLQQQQQQLEELEEPDSPSLVKVHAWYTVTKQGLSC